MEIKTEFNYKDVVYIMLNNRMHEGIIQSIETKTSISAEDPEKCQTTVKYNVMLKNGKLAEQYESLTASSPEDLGMKLIEDRF